MQQEQIVRINYILSVYNNETTEEIRNAEKEYLIDLQQNMNILNDIINVARTQLHDNKFTYDQVLEIFEKEYRELGIEEYLPYYIIKNIVEFNMHSCYISGHETQDLYNAICDIITIADTLDNKLLKTDLYLCVIKLLSTLDIVFRNIEFTQKVMDYYNALPEEERKVSILPDALVTF